MNMVDLIENVYSVKYIMFLSKSESGIYSRNRAKFIFKIELECRLEWKKHCKEIIPKLQEEIVELVREVGLLKNSVGVYREVVKNDEYIKETLFVCNKKIDCILDSIDNLNYRIKQMEENIKKTN